jgi:hypothetical protein
VSSVNRATVIAFVDASIKPGDSMTVFALDDDYSFGLLSSSLHRDWLVERCSTLKGDLRYTPTTVWDSFPWPQSPNQAQVHAITQIAAAILNLREEHIQRGVGLARQYDTFRTLGRSRLRDLHTELDEAVFAAYEFNPADDGLTQLLALNQDIAVAPEPARAGLSWLHRGSRHQSPDPAAHRLKTR